MLVLSTPVALLTACVTLVSADVPVYRPAATCIAHASRGLITGHAALQSPIEGRDVCEWLGVPYAAAPVGDLRFAPPAPVSADADLTADGYGADCPQSPAKLFAYPNRTAQYDSIFTSFVSTTSTTHVQSEDCLKLNIWAPSTLPERRPNMGLKPVLVWIHGGRHASGTSNTPFYNGANLAAAQDVVVVTFNFRMNIFGFPGAPNTAQNVGLLDHYAAVSWVRDNIASFGGDPDRITIAGQSSGAVSVSNWAYAHVDTPIIAGAISHSGNIFSFPTNTLSHAAANWFHVTSSLGCGDSSSAPNAVLTCMRHPNMTFQSILDAVRKVPSPPGNSPARTSPPFQPTQDNTTFFSTEEYIARSTTGRLARIPYLQTHNSHESGLYRISALANGNVSLSEDAWREFENESFTCAVAAEAYYRSSAGIPTYRTLYMADWENTRLYYNSTPGAYGSSGAYHGVDVNMITGNSEAVSGGIPPLEEQKVLTGLMQRAWGSFMSDPEAGLGREMGWSVYEPNRESLVKIGSENKARVEFVRPRVEDGVCDGLGLEFWAGKIDRAEV